MPGAAKAVLDVPLDVSPDVTALRLQNQQLAEQVRTLRSYLDELRTGLAEKEVALRVANGKLDRLRDKTAREIKRQHEIKIRDKEIERLRSVLRSERKYIKKLKKTLERQKKAEIIEETRGLQKLKPLTGLYPRVYFAGCGAISPGKGGLAFSGGCQRRREEHS